MTPGLRLRSKNQNGIRSATLSAPPAKTPHAARSSIINISEDSTIRPPWKEWQLKASAFPLASPSSLIRVLPFQNNARLFSCSLYLPERFPQTFPPYLQFFPSCRKYWNYIPRGLCLPNLQRLNRYIIRGDWKHIGVGVQTSRLQARSAIELP